MIDNYKNGVRENYFQMNYNLLQESWELIFKIGENPNETNNLRSSTLFLGKCCGLSLYDIYPEKRYTIDGE